MHRLTLTHANALLVLGPIGVTGDLSDNDEACALAAIESQGLKPKN